MKRIIAIILTALAAILITAPLAGASAQQGNARRATTSISMATSSCHHEDGYWLTDDFGDDLGAKWKDNDCGWWVWVSAHCANPRAGTDQGWLQSGKVHSIGTLTERTCASPNVVVRGYVKWQHACKCGTVYAKRVIG